MKADKSHRQYLNMRFDLDCSRNMFSASELDILAKHGKWMEALVSGEIKPKTVEQEQFVRCLIEDRDPKTEHEKVYQKLVYRRQFEQDNSKGPDFQFYDRAEAWFPRAACWRSQVGDK